MQWKRTLELALAITVVTGVGVGAARAETSASTPRLSFTMDNARLGRRGG
jgi:hypothetical protein